MYLSTAVLLFLVSKFTYSMPRKQGTTSRTATEWMTFNHELTAEVQQFLQKARKSFKMYCLDKTAINLLQYLKSFRRNKYPEDVRMYRTSKCACETDTNEFSKVYITPSGIAECHEYCFKKNISYKNLINENILQLSTTFLVTDSNTPLRDTIQLETSDDDNISNCVQKGVSYECFCSPIHVVKVSRQFNDFVTTTLLQRRDNNNFLEIKEHFVALVFVLKYYPKAAIFYLRWLTQRKTHIHLKSPPPTTYNDYTLLDTSSLVDGTDIENANFNNGDDHPFVSFVPDDIKLFDKLFNHIYDGDDCNISSFFGWINIAYDLSCYVLGFCSGTAIFFIGNSMYS